ncbi:MULTISPECIES: DUF4062 domain-containing protein [unclassified Pseudomonas]|uniref:DUF4062 domain-containing protein n=1 Tax=unclassified Pseudomonas TaxID=196821 RepID=UPI000C8860CC|nr:MULTISPECIES: DUF4062 domain-containing protein [unclassified Pseudomonas]PMZ92736.1 hypothetical protein C1X61_02335 [Pseudomonas sp. FW215-T2]PNA16692.1 hypothetical protein C1X62_00990 [Pseudomonas sp. FW215-R3]PNB39595.1 hypothetical protein C1X63_01450 [Pseudomonas sp. FW305-131]
MERKYQVFIGSTYTDLIDERQEIFQLLLRNDFIPAGMENFVASSKNQLDLIRPIIDASDIYLLVIAARYGSLSPSGISYTEEEYNYALSQGKPVLAFIHETPRNLPQKNCETDPEKIDLLQKFKIKILDIQHCNMWNNLHELTMKITASLHQAKNDEGLLGWVRGNSELTPKGQILLNQARQKTIELGIEAKQAREDSQRLESSVLALFNEALKPATPSEYDAWEAGAIKQGQPKKLIGHTAHLGEIKIAHKDFVLPVMYGSKAPTIIIQPNVKVYKTDIGHSTLLYMDEFRVEGAIAEIYSDRRVE